MRIDVFSVFPAMVDGPLSDSIVMRARASGRLELVLHDLRSWTHDRHRTVDDTPYGGGPGMVMKAAPIVEGVEEVLGSELASTRVLVTSAGGVTFNQAMARRLASERRLAIVCGHYEGIDQRVVELLRAEEVSIGDYVLTGGELPAAVIIDAVTRLLPGVISADSIDDESHASGLVEYPHFTRPSVYRGQPVPDVLLSGNHAEIDRWRRAQAAERTRRNRLDRVSEPPGS